MYCPPYNRVDADEAVAMISSAGLGHLVSMTADGLMATALPVLVDEHDGNVRLRAHFARANPHWHDLDGSSVLIVFPLTDAYVSPAWYPSKAEHGKVVPTWNYEVVHAHGTATIHHDRDWLLSLVTDLTDQHEATRSALDSGAPRWLVSDAPTDYIDKNLKAIVGLEITNARVEGRRKLSQNRSAADQEGVVAGLERVATSPSLRAAMTALHP